MHTTASDGVLTPTELGRRAVTAGYQTVALTDHDTTAGLSAFRAALGGGVRAIPAIELTCRVLPGPRGTVHLLGYDVDPDDPTLREAGLTNRRAKQVQVRAILAALEREERITIPWSEVERGRGADAYVGRHHVAAALVRRGKATNHHKAFRRYLKDARVPEAEVIGAEQAMAAIKAAGGLTVLAHPNGNDIKHHLEPLLALGLHGIEAYRKRVTPAHRERVLRLATEHGLLVSGGSDWHGHYPEPHFGQWRPPSEPLAPLLRTLGFT